MKRMLIVDDSLIVSKLLGTLLRNKGYDVVECSNVAQAMDSRERFDFAILDYQLPDGDGLAIARELIKKNPDIPMILLTARGGRVSEKDAREAGILYYVEKPVNADRLLSLVQAHIGQS